MLSVAASTQTGTRVVSAEEMEALAVGAWILGTGGGGDPYQKLLNMRQLYKKGYRASLLDPMYLNEDDRVAVVSAWARRWSARNGWPIRISRSSRCA